jgi:HEAT repeat protein
LGQSDTIGFVRQLGIAGDSRAIPVLKKALHHERRSLRTEAALALHALGDPDAVPALISDLHRSIDASDTFHIVSALECIRDPRAATVVAEHNAAESARASEPLAKAKSGCFIATAACGDPWAPEVIALSAFRDDVLRASAIGRAFIRLYYAASPSIAAVIARSTALRRAAMATIVRPAISVVRSFQQSGPRKQKVRNES